MMDRDTQNIANFMQTCIGDLKKLSINTRVLEKRFGSVTEDSDVVYLCPIDYAKSEFGIINDIRINDEPLINYVINLIQKGKKVFARLPPGYDNSELVGKIRWKHKMLSDASFVYYFWINRRAV